MVSNLHDSFVFRSILLPDISLTRSCCVSTHSLDPWLWGSRIILLLVHKCRGDSVVRMWVQLKRVCVLQRGHSGNECDLASTLCKYDLRNR